MATISGQNVLEAEKITSSISRKPNEIESWLLNVNRKSYSAYRLPWLSVSLNNRKGPERAEMAIAGGHIVSTQSER